MNVAGRNIISVQNVVELDIIEAEIGRSNLFSLVHQSPLSQCNNGMHPGKTYRRAIKISWDARALLFFPSISLSRRGAGNLHNSRQTIGLNFFL